LIKWGYSTSEEALLKMPYHIIMKRYKWFEKKEKEEREREESLRFTCPFAKKK